MKKSIFALLILFCCGCSGPKIVAVATQGEVGQSSFSKEIKFDYHQNQIFIEVLINQQAYNFIFDTGTEITTLDKSLLSAVSFKPTVKSKISGSSMDNHEIQLGFLSELSLTGISFHNIGVAVEDLSYVKSRSSTNRKVDGIIGSNILRKAAWQIDYGKQVIRFSDDIQSLSPFDQAYAIKMTPRNSSWGLNKVELNICGKREPFIFDSGSGGRFTTNPGVLDSLKSKLGDTALIEVTNGPNGANGKRVFKIPTLSIGEMKMKDEALTIEKGVSSLMGNQFLQDFVVTMDWQKNMLYLLPVSN